MSEEQGDMGVAAAVRSDDLLRLAIENATDFAIVATDARGGIADRNKRAVPGIAGRGMRVRPEIPAWPASIGGQRFRELRRAVWEASGPRTATISPGLTRASQTHLVPAPFLLPSPCACGQLRALPETAAPSFPPPDRPAASGSR